MNDEVIRHVAVRIARYLAEFPAAADTVEGVHRFWIDAHDACESLEITLAALESLLAQDAIARVAVGNRTLWRLPRRSEAAQRDAAGG